MNKTQERRLKRLERDRLAPAAGSNPTEIYLVGVEKNEQGHLVETEKVLYWRAGDHHAG